MLEYVRNNGSKPRHRGNRLLFLAPDHAALTRLRDCIRVVLAWHSIVEDVAAMRLVLDNLRAEQAKKELKSAEDVLPRVARECFKWLLCPSQANPTDKPSVEVVSLSTSNAALGPEIERVCLDNEWVITTWSPIHLRTKLSELYWKADKQAVKAADFWEDTLRYLYLPRLKDRQVLAQAIMKGAATRDFFGTAYGQHDGKYDGFKIGDANVQFDETLLLMEPAAAARYDASNQPAAKAEPTPTTENPSAGTVNPGTIAGVQRFPTATAPTQTGPTPPAKAKSFHGSVEVSAATAKMRLVQIAEEIIAALVSDPNAEVKVRIEIEAKFANGAQDQTKRTVSENAKTMHFGTAEWE